MSFTLASEYPRPILRPLRLTRPTNSGPAKALIKRIRPQSTSSSWKATRHSFLGTGNRETARCWPPAEFNRDPRNIPDDDKFDTLYDPATATERPGIYRLYEKIDGDQISKPEPVPIPRLVAKRYIPTTTHEVQGPAGEGLTLLMLPGMGTPKEMFEPMIDQLLPQLTRTGVQVDEIWTLDMPLNGETALVNPIGYLYGNEKDITRDILLFITAYLPIVAGQDLPSELIPRRPKENAENPVRKNLHVIAHSLGAQSTMLAAAHAPRIFSSLSVLDPAMIPSGKITNIYTKLPKDVFCTNLQEQYPDTASLTAALKSNKRTRGWNEDAMRIFVERATIPDDGGSIRLTARPRLEWALYYDKETPTHCYDRLKDIRVPFHAIMPSKPFAVPPKQFEADVAQMTQKTRISWVKNSTHQVPYERQEECTKAIVSWIKDITGSEPRARL